MSRAGLKKVRKTVHGKHGTVSRSYWVKSASAVKSGIAHHGLKLGAGALALGVGALAAHHRSTIGTHALGAAKSANTWRRHGGASFADKMINAVGNKLVEHVGGKIGSHLGSRAGAAIGRRLGGRKGRAAGKELGAALGEVAGETAGGHFAERHIKHAAGRTATLLRKKNPFKRAK